MKRHVIIVCFLAVCFWFTPGVNSAELRTWTSKSGKFTVKAELLSLDQGVVSLRSENGKTIKVSLAKLSQQDQEYVLTEPKPKADPVAALKKDGVAELEKLGATIIPNAQGEIVIVDFNSTQDKTQVTDAGLVHLKEMTKLEELWLIGTQVTDAGLVHLKGLTQLKRLRLDDTPVTDAGVAELQKALPKCAIVHRTQSKRRNQPSQLPGEPSQQRPATALEKESVAELEKLGVKIYERNAQGEIVAVGFKGTQVTDAGLVHLKGLTKLQQLDLLDTQVTDAGLVHLKGLTKLKLLGLSRTQVSDAGLVHLNGLTNLEVLALENTQVTDAGLVHLKGLTKLGLLDLSDTQVTDAGVAELKKALPKCVIGR